MSLSTRNIVIGTLIVAFSAFLANSLPDGAPVETCVRSRSNEPNHGQARSQPLETSPYTLTASSSEYGPGSQITGPVTGNVHIKHLGNQDDHDIMRSYNFKGEKSSLSNGITISGAPFKGFFLQARDPDRDGWIGSWAQTENTNTHPECSAVTHADPQDKQHATLIWNAPPNARGRVYFTGTVLKDYATFWAKLVAHAAN